MIRHLFRYIPKIYFKNKEGALWGIIFPLAYGLLFLVIFSNLVQIDTKMEPIPVALVIDNKLEQSKRFQEGISAVAQEGVLQDKNLKIKEEGQDKTLMVYTPVATLEEARQLAKKNIVVASLLVEEGQQDLVLSLEVAPHAINSFSSSIVYEAFSSVNAIYQGINQGIKDENGKPNFAKLTKITPVLNQLQEGQGLIQAGKNVKKSSPFAVYFYSTLAYLSLYFLTSGMNMVNMNEAYGSYTGIRLAISTASKNKRFLVSFLTQLIPSLCVIYLLVYIYYLRNIPLGADWGRLLLILSLGVILGITLGSAIAVLCKGKYKLLNGIAVGLPLLMGAFSGMMSHQLKILINEQAPWINKVNPVALINDGIYYLNNYPSYHQYHQNLLILNLYIMITSLITLWGLRRSDYASL